MSGRRRLDAELVRRGLAMSRSHASELIAEGKVTVAGAPAMNPTRQVTPGEPINVAGPPPKYVGRGGFKLESALDGFNIDVSGKIALDVGASTGGFTDCLLQQGAKSVLALDVGHGQLHEKIRADNRVTVWERTNIRNTTLATLDSGPFEIIVVDVSFISLRTVATSLVGLGIDGADLVTLIKPQFEAGREEVSKGRGVIRNKATWRRSINDVVVTFGELKAATMGVMVSPVLGTEGNVEFLGWFKIDALAGANRETDAGAVDEEMYLTANHQTVMNDQQLEYQSIQEIDLEVVLDQAEALSGGN